MKNPVKVQPPGSDCLFIVFCVEMPGDWVLFAPLGDVPLDPVHISAIESSADHTVYASLVQFTLTSSSCCLVRFLCREAWQLLVYSFYRVGWLDLCQIELEIGRASCRERV